MNSNDEVNGSAAADDKKNDAAGIGYDHLFVTRGTELTLASDFWQNGIIFSDVFLIEQLANIVPGVGLLPIEFVRDLVAATNFIAKVPPELYWHIHLQRYVRAVQLLCVHRGTLDQQTFAMTAHSLGGVVSQAAGPPLKIPVVAFSAPGTVYMSRKFGVSAEATEAYVTNVVVSNDLIPLIGTVNGEVHNINCEHSSSLLCHAIQLSFWRVMHHCDSSRRLFSNVEATYNITPSNIAQKLDALNKKVEAFLGFTLEFGDSTK